MVERREYLLHELVRDHNSARRPVKSADRVPGPVPYYGASGIVDWVQGHTHDGEFLLVSEDGENLRSRSTPVAFPAKGRIWVNNHAHVLSGLEQHDTRFLEYALARTDISGYLTGSAQPKLSKSALESICLDLPSSDERRAIAEVLGALDDKVAANASISQSAFELADVLVRDVIGSTDVRTSELIRTKFGALGELFDGPHATPTRCAEGPYFLNISSLKSGRLDLTESDHVSESDFSKWTRRVTPEEGDLLFSYETRLGEAALLPHGVRGCLGRRMALLRPDRQRVTPEFLLHFYLSPSFQRTIAERTVHGATVPRIGLATMGDWDVEMPAFEQQEVVADTLRELHAATDQADRESARLATVRDELLPLLMSGKVRVKDAEALASEVV
jgi:type I restriction enzyme S subunit